MEPHRPLVPPVHVARYIRPAVCRSMAAAAAGLVLLVAPAQAQSQGPVDRLTQFFGRNAPPPAADYDDDQPIPRPDTGATVRIDRLENRIRELTGQIEQLQFSLRQVQEQMRAAPAGGAVPGRRADEGTPPTIVAATPLPNALPSGVSNGSPLRRGDAFDPTLSPNAPGAPRQIGTLPPSGSPAVPSGPGRLPTAPLDASTPMDLSGSRIGAGGTVIESSRNSIAGTSVAPPTVIAAPAPGALPVTPGGTTLVVHEPISPKDEFDMAMGYLKGGQYEAAEKGFSAFLQKNPKNRLVPEAVFNLGESYFQRGKHTDAAREYLKISTTYSTSPRAPDALLRLGQSLVAFGGKEQACASFAEIGRKYPNASPTVRAAADKESKKNACI